MDVQSVKLPKKRRWVLLSLAGLFLLLLMITLGGFWYLSWLLRSSLPVLSGTFHISSITQSIRIERDDHGVPSIYGSSWPDLAFGLGVVHGQDRYFQMDLLRRKAAGELAALVGPAALGMDRDARVHRFRTRMRQAWQEFSPADQVAIQSYVQGVQWGVSHGLNKPGAKPFEYHLLGVEPESWQPEDCLLAVCAMYQALQSSQIPTEKWRADIAAAFPSEVARFLDPNGTPWDAPIDGSTIPIAPLPTPAHLNFRKKPLPLFPAGREGRAWIGVDETPRTPVIGSNNWAVAGTHSFHGGALIANDMHLQLQMPNIWYRVALYWMDTDGTQRRACGVTLPGGPAIVAGSNGQIAWAFTNTEGDWLDLLGIDVHPNDPKRYRTADGWKEFLTHREEIKVKGEPGHLFEVQETIWGPVVERDRQQRAYALRWLAHQPETVNLKLAEMLQARTLEEALTLTSSCGLPNQNFVCGDRSGRIAWTIIGKIPRRVGDVKRHAARALDQCQWAGFVNPQDYPRVVNPEGGRIWTANNRIVGSALWDKIGNGGVDAGLRAGQIRDRLLALDKAGETDLFAIQLDDEARSYLKWSQLFLKVVQSDSSGFPRRAQLRRLVAAWDGHAKADSVGYRILDVFRREVRTNVFEPFREEMLKKTIFGSGFGLGHQQQEEGPLWAIVSACPEHLLSSRFSTWNELFLDAVDRTARVMQLSGRPLERTTWGQLNATWVRHPLGMAVPILGRWLDIQPNQLPGARHDLPRVSSPFHGASERFVVSPGKEEKGIFHMPGGQSGHPLSPYYRDGHAAWEQGQPTPFLPGPKVNELIFQPITK